MPTRGVPLTGLYVFSGACALFATGYGALDLEPAPAMAFLVGWGPTIAVAWWLAADSKRTRVVYGLALVGPLGFVWGATLRHFVVS